MVLTQHVLKRHLNYEPDSGVFTWILPTHQRIKAGETPGSHDRDGYLRIKIFRKSYRASRLAWLYMTGSFPKGQIDHKNTVRADNKWSNLRDVTQAVNQQNRRRAHADSHTGFLGVRVLRPSGRYQARIFIEGRHRTLGAFDSAKEAHDAYVAAKRQLHEGNTL